MFRRCVFGAMAFWLAAPVAGAAPIDYCKAYAIDFADQTQRDTPFWQQRYSDAEKACLAQFTFADPEEKAKPVQAAKAKPKPKPQAVEAQAEAMEAAPEEVDISAAAISPQPRARKKPKLVVGSGAWLDYCDRKYASFDREKGTYRSYSGVERKCLVTANSQ